MRNILYYLMLFYIILWTLLQKSIILFDAIENNTLIKVSPSHIPGACIKGCVFFQVTRRTPVNSRPVTSTRSVRSTSGRGRRSASATQATSAWTVCPVRASASCGLTSASMTASVTSSLAREPSAGGCRLASVICQQHLGEAVGLAG